MLDTDKRVHVFSGAWAKFAGVASLICNQSVVGSHFSERMRHIKNEIKTQRGPRIVRIEVKNPLSFCAHSAAKKREKGLRFSLHKSDGAITVQ